MSDVTAVVNLHREASMARAALESAARAIELAQARGITCELLAVLDRSDEATEREVQSFAARVRLRSERTDFGELARARNHAAQVASSAFVGFLDADDLWSRNWLADAYLQARANPQAVQHPETNVIFGARRLILKHPDMRDRCLSTASLRSVNYWTSLSLASRDLYLRFPYRPNRINEGFGFEDWAWHCETIEAGIEHWVVPNTSHFVRSKASDSMREQTIAQGCLRSATGLFVLPDRKTAARMRSAENTSAISSRGVERFEL